MSTATLTRNAVATGTRRVGRPRKTETIDTEGTAKPTPRRRGPNKPKTVEPTPPVTGYESGLRYFSGRYKQGGRTVYAMDLSIAQIVGLIPAPDPERPSPGNRRIQPAHAAAFGEYIRTHHDWISPALVLRGPSTFEFAQIESIEGAEFGVVELPLLAVADLHILDGQHRILGMHMAVRGIADDLDKARDGLSRARKAEDANLIDHFKEQIKLLNDQRKRFETERVAIQLFVETNQRAYQQMFYDIADNALGITASVRARFDTRKITNRVLADVIQHPLLRGRVDMERDRLGRVNPNFLSAKHVADIVRIMAVGLEGRISRRLEDELNEERLIETTLGFFSILTESFHQLEQVADGSLLPTDLRQHSMLGSPVTIRVLAGVAYELRQQGYGHDGIVHFFQRLDPYLSQPATKLLVEHGGQDVFFDGAMAPSARRQDVKEFRNVLVSWAEDPPSWLTA